MISYDLVATINEFSEHMQWTGLKEDQVWDQTYVDEILKGPLLHSLRKQSFNHLYCRAKTTLFTRNT